MKLLTEDEKQKIRDAEKKAYVKEKTEIAKSRGRRIAQWEDQSFLEKYFGWIGDLFK